MMRSSSARPILPRNACCLHGGVADSRLAGSGVRRSGGGPRGGPSVREDSTPVKAEK